MHDDEDRSPHREPRARRTTRRERTAARRGRGPVTAGGITAPCGCRCARTGGQWIQVRPCTAAHQRPFPISDENMKTLMEAR